MSNFKLDPQDFVNIFKALSNEHRLSLFQRLTNCCVPGTKCSLANGERYCVGELGQEMNIAPSTLSHHLKELNRAGLVQMERRGKNVECWVDPGILTMISHFFKPAGNS